MTGPDGTERWLTVPVHLPAGRATLIQDVVIADPDHASKRVSGIIRRDYRHSRYWPDVCNQVTPVQEAFARSERLAEISQASTLALLRALGWTGAAYRSSELTARHGRSQHLADLTVAVGAGTYLCGTGGAKYLDPAPFGSSGIRVAYFRPPDRLGCPAHGNRATALDTLAAAGAGLLSGWLAVHAQSLHLPHRAA